MFKKELFNQVLTIPFETMSNIFEERVHIHEVFFRFDYLYLDSG